MNRGTQARLAVAALIALGVLAAPAVAAPPATEEYVLDLPGVSSSRFISPAEVEEPPAAPAGAAGIVGERNEPLTPLAAIGRGLATPAGLLALAPAALLLLALRRSEARR
jgi:hypothetical protein